MRLERSVVGGIGWLKDQVVRQRLEMASVNSTSLAERVVKSFCRDAPPRDAMTRS